MSDSTPDKLIRATEQLFGEQGYSATTLRTITDRAGVNLAAVNYHFGGKEKLFEAMISARVSELNKRRLRLLKEERLRRGDEAMPLETLFSILLHPLGKVLVLNGKMDISFMKMIARFLTEPSPFIRKLHEEYFREIKTAFGSEVARTLPGETTEELAWKFYISATCMMGALTQYNHFESNKTKTNPAETVRTLINRLILFIVAGMKADLTRTDWLETLHHYEN